MSQRNDNEVNPLVMLAVACGLVGVVIAVFAFAVAAFACFLLTTLSLFAWNRPRTYGRLTIHPQQARAFVARGVFGAFVLPAFVAFCDIMFGIGVDWNYAAHIAWFGYLLGSLGVELLAAASDSEEAAAPGPAPRQLPSHHQPTSPEPQYLPPSARTQQSHPFRYATWDDEEAGR